MTELAASPAVGQLAGQDKASWPDCLVAFDGEQGTIDTGCAVDRLAEFIVVRDAWGLQGLLDWMAERRPAALAIDSETNGVDPWAAGYRCRTIQISDATLCWVVVVEDLGPDEREHLRQMLHDYPRWVAAPAEVDIRFIERELPGAFRLDEDEPHVLCWQVALAFHDPRTVVPAAAKDGLDIRISRRRGLKDTTTREISPVLADVEKRMHARWRELAPVGHRTPVKCRTWGFANVPSDDPTYLTYSALDPLMTMRTWQRFQATIDRTHAREGWWAYTREQWSIDQQTMRGIGVDPPYVRWLHGQLGDLVTYYARYLEGYGVKPSGMGPAVGEAFTKLGVPVLKRGKGSSTRPGGPSWDREVLDRLTQWKQAPGTTPPAGPPGTEVGHVVADDGEQVRELARTIKAVRQATKFEAAYVAPMLDALDRDGRVHWSHRALGTVTSRQSAARPALQQQPKKDTRVRAAYTADPGFVIVSCDLSQGEPRCMAALSGDPVLRDDIYAGDLNGAIAAAAFGSRYVPADGKTAGRPSYLMRQGGKAGFLAKCYGAGRRKVDATVGVAEGTDIGRAWEGRYHRLFRYADELNQRASVVLENGWVIPLWDRFTVGDSGSLRLYGKPSRKGLNYATQGSQRMLLQQCWLRLVDRGWGWAGYFWLHDEILLHVPEFMAQAAADALKDAMTFEWRGVRFDCEPEINGRTWLPQPATFDPREIAVVDDIDEAA